jgi:hypothetical protein
MPQIGGKERIHTMKVMSVVRALIVVALTCVVMTTTRAQEAPDHYEPANTRVAILPVINLSGEKNAGFREKQIQATREALHNAFGDRGFVIVDDKSIEDAATAAKIDLNDEEQHTRSTIVNLGNSVKADLVAFVVINKVWSKQITNFFSATDEGYAKIAIWLIDLKTEKAILNGIPHQSKEKREAYFRGQEKFSDLIARACGKAVRESLTPILKPYPIAGKEDRRK